MNDPLAALRLLHAPPPIAWWPPAPGWWLLLLLSLLVALLAVWWWLKRTAPQRTALRELDALRLAQGDVMQQASTLNRLLKRYALACWPSAEVAALTSEKWLVFLDRHGGKGEFSQGAGRALLTLPYGGETHSLDELLALAHRWIKTNRPGREG